MSSKKGFCGVVNAIWVIRTEIERLRAGTLRMSRVLFEGRDQGTHSR